MSRETSGERPFKRQRLSLDAASGNNEGCDAPPQDISLQERLTELVICCVCLDLPPKDENLQCSLGHVICEDCVTRLLAEASLRNEGALCPLCRLPISWENLSQNLTLSQVISELPRKCPDCDLQLSSKSMSDHQKKDCVKRLVMCQYRCLGCTWQGCQVMISEHERSCKYPHMSSDEILEKLQEMDKQEEERDRELFNCFRQLSAPRVIYKDLEMILSQRSSIHKSPFFQAFDKTWRLRGRANLTISEVSFSYKLQLRSHPSGIMSVKFFITLPARDITTKQMDDVKLQLVEHNFSKAYEESRPRVLPMKNKSAIYRLIARTPMKLRLWMSLY